MGRKGQKSWSATVKEELGVSTSPLVNRSPQAGKRQTRAAAERKASRREKARRWIAYSGEEGLQQKMNARLERLESTNFSDPLDRHHGENLEEADEESDEYSAKDLSATESDEFDDEDYGSSKGKKKRRRKSKTSKQSSTKAKIKGTKRKQIGSNKTKSRKAWKKGRVKSFAEMLLNENANKMSNCRTKEDLIEPDYINATVKPSRYPKRRFCVITGQPAKYKDPASSLYYSSLKAYRTLKEHPPPWVRSAGIAPYFEAIESIKQERKAFLQRLK